MRGVLLSLHVRCSARRQRTVEVTVGRQPCTKEERQKTSEKEMSGGNGRKGRREGRNGKE